ncbi:hypothetical protein L596_029637 [Steinernema carpocapsae]|uniref:Uncharacterized protein n=1 Tax=Steinernema carpocapsae TaxID=34508 RepID=A0A4U5LV83_STECR|nr:hypothetical protein L596_029637 [Steinernema carpocapsae]
MHFHRLFSSFLLLHRPSSPKLTSLPGFIPSPRMNEADYSDNRLYIAYIFLLLMIIIMFLLGIIESMRSKNNDDKVLSIQRQLHVVGMQY